MTADLESRRQAIAEALRAVMAEPFPDRTDPAPTVAVLSRATSPPTGAVATAAAAPSPAPVEPAEPAAPVAPVAAVRLRAVPAGDDTAAQPLREALVAHIDWDNV